jgi:hypothetical protein
VDLESRQSLISVRLQMLCSLFGKRVAEENWDTFKRVYCEGLENFPADALSRGFKKAEQNCERFPSPKLMRDLCGEFISGAYRYNFRPMDARDPETGAPVKAKQDMDTGEMLYRATDCPEGRAFLAKLAELAKRGR